MPSDVNRSRFVYIGFACFIIAGVQMIWLAEVLSAGVTRPFSYWYLAFVAYAVYAVMGGVYLRRRLARELGRTDLPLTSRSRSWFTREITGMCFAFSPIVTFAVARAWLRMPIWYSVPWYALGFLLLILWRPSEQPASGRMEGGHLPATNPAIGPVSVPSKPVRAIRQMFGWYFAFLAVGMVVSAALFGHKLLAGYSEALAVATAASLGLSVCVFIMAWWSTWRDKRRARIWGIAASLLMVAPPLALIHFDHHPLGKIGWNIVLVNGLALIAYAWPDRKKEHRMGEQIVG